MSITPCSPRPRLGTLLSPGPCCHSGLGKTSVPLVMSSPSWSCLMSCTTSLCTLSCSYPSRAANSSHSSLLARLQRRRCEHCVIRTGQVRLALFDDDAFPDGRGELWVTSLAILACCRSVPAATAVLNSWNSVSCLKVSLFSSIILAFSVWSVLFLIRPSLLPFDSSILWSCGCPFHASLQLAFRPHAL